jgi:uncharacterized protein YyaL (SSP411 family)
MERESFEDQDIAEILNRSFVSIKVDREERPDIDHIYITVCQAMTGQGGWPLTVVMTPEKQPFFAGSYFPKTGRGRMVGLREILLQIINLWNTERSKVLEIGKNITGNLEAHLFHGEPSGDLDETVLQDAFNSLVEKFDPVYGGFGSAPKFPTPQNLYFLLRYWKVYHEEQALRMVEDTLTHMFQGGIYDHIGYGFSRYSTDEKWLVPHFEKMLYDNALLAIAYLETYQATKKELFKEVAEEILTYIRRDMMAPEGGFYAAEDADSEGVEGKFYLWTPEEITAILGNKDGADFCHFYDISKRGNFEGKSIPNLINQKNLSQRKVLLKQRSRLFEEREKRIHPFKDDKILTSWNGLMIAAFSIAARVLGHKHWREVAIQAANFVLNNLRTENGRLLARFRDGESAYLGYIDDYAFLTWGLIELYQASFQPHYLQEALRLSQDLITHFHDDKKGGFFLYGNDGEQLIARPKEIYDGATPSGNSVTALNFLKLSRLTGEHHWEEKALEIQGTFSSTIRQYPAGYSYLLMAQLYRLNDAQEIVLASPNGLLGLNEMIREINHQFRPFTVVLVADQALEKDIPSLKGYSAQNDQGTAYVCRNFACQAPTTDIKQLKILLDEK